VSYLKWVDWNQSLLAFIHFILTQSTALYTCILMSDSLLLERSQLKTKGQYMVLKIFYDWSVTWVKML